MDMLERFRRSLQAQGRSPRTIATYCACLAKLEQASEKHFLTDPGAVLNASDCWTFLEENAGDLSGAYLKQILAAAKKWHRWGHSMDLWSLNGIVSIPSPYVRSEPGPALTHREVTWLLDQCSEPGPARLILLGLYAGCRLSESERMVPSHWLSDRLRFKGSKTGVTREIPLSPLLIGERGLILSTSPTRRQLRWAYEKLKGDSPFEWTTHTLRRTFSQVLLDAEVEVEVVEALMGHTHRSTTLRSYGRVPWGRKVGAIGRLTY